MISDLGFQISMRALREMQLGLSESDFGLMALQSFVWECVGVAGGKSEIRNPKSEI